MVAQSITAKPLSMDQWELWADTMEKIEITADSFSLSDIGRDYAQRTA